MKGVASALAALAALFAAATAWAADGQALYEGREAVPARLRGEDYRLPASAARCANCHEAAAAGRAYAPPLDRESLLKPVPRRAGPPSVYDERAFCRTLREGVDPAHMLLRRAMPQFDVDDVQCKALWAFLSQRTSERGAAP